jgi:predicted N-acyltransferase
MTGATDLRLGIHDRISAVPAADWDALAVGQPPFIQHAFLAALESSASVSSATGWQPCHLTLRDATGRLQAALPLYLKQHSWGEFVFDFAWADAAQRAGLDYYPKLLAAVPYSPITTAKPLLPPGVAHDAAVRGLLAGVDELLDQHAASGLHVLHAEPGDLDDWTAAGCCLRASCQYHWVDAGYGDHAGFLAAQTHDRRKKVKQELRRVADAGIHISWVDGHALHADDALADTVWQCYADTYLVRGQAPYLTRGFWTTLARDLPDALQVALAWRADQVIAAAICLRDATTLYGRHWGALEEHRDLHFVLCYHAGIARCLELGLSRFEPGVQGEHKVWRGFAPTLTWSLHRLTDPGLHAAVTQWCARERRVVEAQADALSAHLPFRSAS